MTLIASYNPLEIADGVSTLLDATPSDVQCWVDTYHVRFDPNTGRLRKIGGWQRQPFNNDALIDGEINAIYSQTINGRVYTIIGTNTRLYSLIGSQLVNITPLETTPIAIPDSLDTNYYSLSNNPIATVNGSTEVTISDANASIYKVGDSYTLSGATTTNGVPNTELNSSHFVRGIGANAVMIIVGTAATSTGSGGGNSVIATSGLVTVNATAHGLKNGDRVGIEGAVSFGGITNVQMNREFIIRNVQTDSFDVMTSGTASSSVTGGGGAATEYYPPIAAGNANAGLAQGYGVGLYGVGLYGTALTSNLGITYPRIWFMDRFGDNILMTAGDNSEIYSWDGSTVSAPVVVANAPTDVNYIFVSNNILNTLGSGFENNIFSSDIGNITQWTSSSTNQVFEDRIEGAQRFISHAPVDGYNLLFTEQQVYTFKYIGQPLIWQIQLLDNSSGLLAPMARVSVNGIAYWMGQDNFYMFRGGKVEVIPSNLGPQCTNVRYVFDNLNWSQRFKAFAWYNEEYDEIWFHYPSGDSLVCDKVERFSRKRLSWCPDAMERTAGEYPFMSLSNPRLGGVGGVLYLHEVGNDADGQPMEWYATTKKYISGKQTNNITQIVPDNYVTGDININVRTFNYPQSGVPNNSNNYTISPNTDRMPIQVNGRYYDMTLSGDSLGQNFLMGQWFVETQKGANAP